MKTEQCIMDTRVFLTGTTLPLQSGKIAGPVTQHPSAGEVVVVEWSSGLMQKVTIRSLLTEPEADVKTSQMAEEAFSLEQEWQQKASTIGDKMKIAAKLIKEADQLAHKSGHELMYLYDEVHPLMKALSDAGWSTSSMIC